MPKELVIKPVLTYGVYQRHEAVSWRPWGGITSDEQAEEEAQKIEKELLELKEKAEFPLRILPISLVKSYKQARNIEMADVILLYAAGGDERLLISVLSRGPTIVFIRHRSGPLYLWYEIIDARLIRRYNDQIGQTWIDYDDVVVDNLDKLLRKLRALYGLKNTVGARVVAVGGASGWAIGRKAAELAKLRWKLDIVEVSYDELSERIKKAKSDSKVVEEAQRKTKEYLSSSGVQLKTKEDFVVNAFVLYYVFKKLLEEHDAEIITINECMSTIMPIAKTTACLTLSLLNDEGYLAFCESDFVAIPAGILLHYISSKPVFLNDPTLPHDGIVTVAHCTAPRKMDGKRVEPVKVVTHFESDWGAAPKVEFRKGEIITMLIPDFEEKTWVGFRGKIVETPFLPICRSQAEIEIEGDWRRLLWELKGFHWIMAYGDYLDELGYALKKAGMKWVKI
ncbi:MAG: sugar isomerase [Desulfurococcales archaeon ex4484_217_2]|nr:MAG: sugar isomerase [Desulfurococcales archaeon ex4484_217_2]